MARTLTVCALVLSWPLLVRADDPPKPTETIIKLTVSPMAAARPALRYLLLPELREMTPGNPVHGYLKCFMEQNHFFHHKDSIENRERWRTMPLKDLPLAELRTYGGVALRRADDAARMDTPDWQILLEMKRDGINTLLPEVQQIRTLAGALQVRYRAEVADRRFEDALRTARTLFAMSRHLGEHPTLIANLVGMAIAQIAITTTDELLDQPGCPNLYWGFAHLPNPLVSFTKGLQGERMFLATELAFLDEKAVMSEAQLGKAIDRLRKLLELTDSPGKGGPTRELGEWLKMRSDDVDLVGKARKRLVEYGLDPDTVKRISATQVILLDEKREFEVRRDEELKWVMLPAWQAVEGLRSQHFIREGEELLFGKVLGPAAKLRRAQGRLEQRFAMMRVVEALRMHAAANQGALPEKLSDVKAVPIPEDPFTGKAFSYKREGRTALLRGTPPPGEEQNAAFKLLYEVTIRD